MAAPQIDLTQIIVTIITMIGSYFFGKRRGRKSRVEPLSEKDLDEIDKP